MNNPQPTSQPELPPASVDSAGMTMDDAGSARAPGNGRRHGRFLILRAHAAGGLGEVSVALDESLGRVVALKQIREDLAGSAGTRRRFINEAEVTGQLQHPGIVPLYVLGQDDEGRPYYAMKFVEGNTLEQEIDHYHAAPSAIAFQSLLRRFVDVCEAVAYAHSRAIIHRDLKPANVMAGKFGETLVLDWGLAKRVNGLSASGQPAEPSASSSNSPPLPEASRTAAGDVVTVHGSAVGTPAYMAPEQARGQHEAVGPAADVYALGAMLYHIITGSPPDATRAAGGSNAALRGASATRPLLAVCAKAMAPRPEDRYPAVEHLAREVDRWLADEPVGAYREPWAKRAARWARRHKPLAVGAAVLLLTALVALIASNMLVARERDQKASALAGQTKARAEAEAANQGLRAVNDFFTRHVIGSATPEVTRGRDLSVREALAAAAERIDQQFTNQPLIEAGVRQSLSSAYLALGRADLALPHAERALQERRALLGEDHPDTIAALQEYALVIAEMGRLSEAEPLMKRALERRRAVQGEDHPDTLTSLNNYAWALESLGRFAEAEPLYRQGLEQCRRILGEDHPDTITSLSNYAFVLESLGRFAEAEPLYRRALEQRRRVQGQDHPDTITALANYAAVLSSLGRLADAIPLLEQALEQRRQVMGEDHPKTIESLNNYASVLKSLGRAAEAEPLARQVLERRRRILGEDHPDTIRAVNNYAFVLNALGRTSEAESFYREAFARHRRIQGDDHPDTLRSMSNHAQVLQALGRLDQAEPLAREALERRRLTVGMDHPDTITALNNYAGVLTSLGRIDEAEPLLAQALAQRRRVLGHDHRDTIHSLKNHAFVLESLGRHADAEPLLAEVYRRAPSAQMDPKQVAQLISYYGPCLATLGKYEAAEQPLGEAIRRLRETGQTNGPRIQAVLTALVAVCDHTNRPDEAAEWRAELAALDATTQPAQSR